MKSTVPTAVLLCALALLAFVGLLLIITSGLEPPPQTAAASAMAAQAPASPLDAYYTEPASCVPVDHAPLVVGACPPSKPQSRALPIADVPACILTREV